MSVHSKIREDKTCLNCGYEVSLRYCSKCGQENKETKESFYFLFTHTFQDIIHYDSNFWKTIRYLLFSPGRLTCEYLSGKRQSYVAPVRLYIFISIITFFLISVYGGAGIRSNFKISAKPSDALENTTQKDGYNLNLGSIRSENLPRNSQVSGLNKELQEKFQKTFSNKNALEKINESYFHNFPKVLFLLMPIFAFVIWVFHSKTKWYYFEHGIFTLHVFSMILLSFLFFRTCIFIMDMLFSGAGNQTFYVILFFLLLNGYVIVYFIKVRANK